MMMIMTTIVAPLIKHASVLANSHCHNLPTALPCLKQRLDLIKYLSLTAILFCIFIYLLHVSHQS